MKKLFELLIVTGIYFLAVPVCMSATSSTQTTDDDTQGIDFNGDLNLNLQRSLINPIEAFVTEACIEVNFNASLGNLSLSIEDEWGNVVYRQAVNASAGQALFIDIGSFEQGFYTIEFTTGQGQYLAGDFEI